MTVRHGREFLSIPGPTNIPDEVLQAMHRPAVDIYSGGMLGLGDSVHEDMKKVFRTKERVYIYAANGHGGWEAAFSNVLSKGDKVLVLESGRFAVGWGEMAAVMGAEVEVLPQSIRRAVDPAALEARLKADKAHAIKAIMVVQIDTASSCVNDIPAIRKAMNAAKHPALLMVDTISGLASADYRHDEWGVDVTVSGSQKGLMLPPGISFNAISPKALEASKTAKLPRSFWAWDEIVEMNRQGYWPYTPNTNLLYGLSEALDMILEQGLDAVFARHRRWAEGVRGAVRAWGLPIQCADASVYSPVLTGVITPQGVDADAIRKLIHERFDLSLGTGLGKVKGRMFRIGHLGDCNDLTLMAALSGVEMGFKLAGVAIAGSGVQAAMEHFAAHPQAAPLRAAA